MLRPNQSLNTVLKEYIKKVNENKIPTALTLKFNKRTRILYWLFWSSYNLDINENSFYQLFDEKFEDMLKFELKLAELMKLIEKYRDGYKLTTKGAYYFHLVEQKYTNQYIDKTWKISRKTPWPEKILLY